MNKTAKTMKKCETEIINLKTKLVQNVSDSLPTAISTILTAMDFSRDIHHPEIDCNEHIIARINQETGELCHFLVHFQDFDLIYRILYYLEAYLTTNKEFLEETTIDELKFLINYLR